MKYPYYPFYIHQITTNPNVKLVKLPRKISCMPVSRSPLGHRVPKALGPPRSPSTYLEVVLLSTSHCTSFVLDLYQRTTLVLLCTTQVYCQDSIVDLILAIDVWELSIYKGAFPSLVNHPSLSNNKLSKISIHLLCSCVLEQQQLC